MPSPEYLDGIVVDVMGEVEARLAEAAQRSQLSPFSAPGDGRNDK
jgi:hypothetical protein